MSKSNCSKRLYFLTLKLLGRYGAIKCDNELIDKKELCDEIVKTLIHFINTRGMQLYGFVLISDQLHLIIESEKHTILQEIRAFKHYSSNEIFRAISKRLSNCTEKENRKEKDLRGVFSLFLNNDDNCLWQAKDNFIELPIRSHQKGLKLIGSDELLLHFTDCKKNYKQLGAYAFTKVMMKSMSI